ncbi:MAG TPA: NAD(P)/FAD-dependent oxidoreductase, partial [Gemmatimonadales bacterium]|nr:NAD(P)/FAD-dependent oxidoreductase [Gemmatimonadales bacterium]
MTLARTVDVLVVGAGPGGSSAAIRFARLGLRVLVLDRATFPRDKPCAEYMGPVALRHFDDLGVLPTLDAAGGHPLAGSALFAGSGRALVGRFAGLGAAYRPTGLSLARRVLDAVLVARAREVGAVVEEGIQVTDLLYGAGGVSGVVVRGAEGAVQTIRAALVVGADGLRSTIARKLGPRRHGAPSRIGFVAHVADVDRLGDVAEIHVTREGYVGLNPIGGGVANVGFVVSRTRAREAGGDPAAFFYKMLERFPGVAGRIHRARERREVLVTGPFAASASHVTAPGALLLGDAAEFFDPVTGDGIQTALTGSELAVTATGDALVRTGRVTAVQLTAYRALRRERFLAKWIMERAIGWGMELPP